MRSYEIGAGALIRREHRATVTWTAYLLALNLFESWAENSVQKGRRFGRGKFLGKFERFVNHDVRRERFQSAVRKSRGAKCCDLWPRGVRASSFPKLSGEFVRRRRSGDRAFEKLIREFAS